MYPRIVWSGCEVETVLCESLVVQHEVDGLENEGSVVVVGSVCDLGLGCDDVCDGLDQDGGGVEVNGDESGIVEKVAVGVVVGDELEMKIAGGGAVIWSVVGLVEE